MLRRKFKASLPVVVRLFLPSARSWLPWVRGLGLDLNFFAGEGSGLRWGPWETRRPRWQLRPMGPERERHSSASNAQRDGQQGARWGCSSEGCFGCLQSHGRTGPPGSSPVCWPRWHGHGPGHGLWSSHCTVTNCRPGFGLRGLPGSLNCKRETTWVGPRTLQNTLFPA